jgi:hypothetical protein
MCNVEKEVVLHCTTQWVRAAHIPTGKKMNWRQISAYYQNIAQVLVPYGGVWCLVYFLYLCGSDSVWAELLRSGLQISSSKTVEWLDWLIELVHSVSYAAKLAVHVNHSFQHYYQPSSGAGFRPSLQPSWSLLIFKISLSFCGGVL